MADKPTIRVPAGSSKDVRQDMYVETMLGGVGGVPGFGSGANPVSGLQDPHRDRTVFNRAESFAPGLWMDQQNIDLYMTSGLASRIVDLVAEDCTSNGITIEGDDAGGILSELNRLRWAERFTDCIRWARLHGGAAIILLTDDAPDLSMPLNVNNIGRITELRVVDVTFLSIYGYHLEDPMSQDYGLPERYMVQTKGMATPYVVHQTRLITFTGGDVPGYISRSLNVPWRGRSVYQGCRRSLLRYANALAWAERMLERKQQVIWKMYGLADLLLQSYDSTTGTSAGSSIIRDRTQSFDMVRGILNTGVIDGEDNIETKDLSMGGVYEIIQAIEMEVSGDTGLPVTNLFGRSPSGHNATGQSDQENYDNIVENVQHNKLEPGLLRLIPLILLQREYTFDRPKGWTLSFNPLRSLTDEQQAKAKMEDSQGELFLSQAITGYVEAQILSPDDAARWLAQGKKFGLTPELLLERDPIPVEAEEAETANNDPDV